jgi:hypothetical protein
MTLGKVIEDARNERRKRSHERFPSVAAIRYLVVSITDGGHVQLTS